MTNCGDETQLILAFKEQVLLARHRLGALAPNAVIRLEDMWATHPDEDVQAAWRAALTELSMQSCRIILVPLEERCRTVVDNPRKGRNMFALGVLARIHGRDLARISDQTGYAQQRSRPVQRSKQVVHA